jgi:uncharacterized membrane protein YfhO
VLEFLSKNLACEAISQLVAHVMKLKKVVKVPFFVLMYSLSLPLTPLHTFQGRVHVFLTMSIVFEILNSLQSAWPRAISDTTGIIKVYSVSNCNTT